MREGFYTSTDRESQKEERSGGAGMRGCWYLKDNDIDNELAVKFFLFFSSPLSFRGSGLEQPLHHLRVAFGAA